MSREPLAALVARLLVMGNGECGCPAVASPKFCEHEKAYIEAAMGAVPRLLAAVEAGTKCADALERVRSLMASMRTLGYFTNDEWRERLLAAGIALEDWKRVAEPVAPASHGSPEQGR